MEERMTVEKIKDTSKQKKLDSAHWRPFRYSTFQLRVCLIEKIVYELNFLQFSSSEIDKDLFERESVI